MRILFLILFLFSFSAHAFELRVLTLNLNGLPLGVDHTRYADVGKKLGKLREVGTAPHVVVLQEAFSKYTEDAIRYSAYPFLYRGPGSQGLKIRSGLVILSEFPILEAGQLPFESCTGFDCFARKGVHFVKIQAPQYPTPLYVANTHLNADPGGPETSPEEAARVRLDQVNQIQSWFWDLGILSEPLIFGGDFNFQPETHEYFALTSRADLGDTGKQCVDQGCSQEENPREVWKESIDHQFYRSSNLFREGGLSLSPVFYAKTFKEVVNGRTLSDHLGVEVHYQVEW